MTRAEAIERWRKTLAGANAAMQRPLVRAMRLELVKVADDFEAGRWNASIHRARVEELVVSSYTTTVRRFYPYAIAMLETPTRARPLLLETRDVEGVLFSDRIAGLVRQQGPSRARQIAARTARMITAALAEAAEQGLGEAAAARLVRDRVASSRIGLARARTIARTEIGAAQNAGLLASADTIGVAYGRTWLTISDGRERLSHALADEQTIGAGEKFTVGDAQLDHPCDPTGPPEEIINCRCTMLLEPL